PRGARPYVSLAFSGAGPSFNPRARVGRDFGSDTSGGLPARFQSTRPRGARRRTGVLGGPSRAVSIHAPAWGATRRVQRFIGGDPVSIHAPAWGATAGCIIRRIWTCRFNPRARVGRDHRPGPGAAGRQSFNPRARVGRDRWPPKNSSITRWFQS